MSSSSTVTYTSVYSDSEPWRFQWVSDDELEAPMEASQSLRHAPPSLDYVPGPEHPPSLDYVPGPEEPEQAPLSSDYVLEPEYPEYLVPSDAKEPIEDHPLLDDASPTTLSPGYVTDFDPEEDPVEDLEEDHVDYPADGGDDDDDDDEVEHEAPKEDENEEEEHLALTDSSDVLVDDPVPSAKDTEAFETDESAPTPPSPRPRRARIPIPSPPLHVPSPPLPLPSPPTHTSLTYANAPLGYRAAGIRLRVISPPPLLPSTAHRDDIPEADLSLRKRARFTAPTGRFEVGESSAAAAARQPRLDIATVDATPGRPISREGILQQIPAFYFICASLEAISAIEDTWERGEVWGDIQVVPGFLLGGKDGFRHEVPPTKRLFKVAMLDPSPEFTGHWGMFGDLGLPIVAQILLSPIGYLDLSTCLWDDLRWRDDVWTTYLSMTFAKWSLQKWVPRSLMIARGARIWRRGDLRNLQTTRASLVGSAFGFNQF
ncbi:hypothetical protein Tco_0491650 [Tanacetum coccineum]